jgi:hypothetical protein
MLLIDTPLVLAAITIGELRRGVGFIRHRGDHPQAQLLELWLVDVLQTYRAAAGAQSLQRHRQTDRRNAWASSGPTL